MKYLMLEISSLASRELKKWYRSKVLLVVTLIQPVLWLGLFGKAMNVTGLLKIPDKVLMQLPPYITTQISAIFNMIVEDYFGISGIDYFSYMAIGMMTIIILFTSMFSGMSIVLDRRFGFLNKLLAAPISRASIVISKVLASMIRAVVQATLIFFISLAFGLKLNIAGIYEVIIAILTLFILSLGLSSMFIAITVNVKSWEAHMGIINLINLPLMFASNILYPIKLMPDWLKGIASINPLSFATNVLRQALLYGEKANIQLILHDFIATLIFGMLVMIICVFVSNRALREL